MVSSINQLVPPVPTLRKIFFSPVVVEFWSSCTQTMAVLESTSGFLLELLIQPG